MGVSVIKYFIAQGTGKLSRCLQNKCTVFSGNVFCNSFCTKWITILSCTIPNCATETILRKRFFDKGSSSGLSSRVKNYIKNQQSALVKYKFVFNNQHKGPNMTLRGAT